jgi:GntR family transcriptional regulator
MIKIETSGFIPIYEQIKKGIKSEISLGVLKPNAALSSIRDLAAALVINPNTVARAYRELELEGLITTRKGKASFVSENSTSLVRRDVVRLIEDVFDRAIAEARKFGLEAAEIRRIVDSRLKNEEKRGEGDGR